MRITCRDSPQRSVENIGLIPVCHVPEDAREREEHMPEDAREGMGHMPEDGPVKGGAHARRCT